MKRFTTALPFILVFIFIQAKAYGQAIDCPILSLNGGTVSCDTTCVTLNAVPSTYFATTTSYAVSSIPYTAYSFTGGTEATYDGAPWSGLTDDSYGDLVPLPFNFCFFGTSYSSIVIGTNGNINFSSSLANGYDPYDIPGPLPGSNCAATENAIMGVWCDTYVGGGDITYNVYGSAPCRQFVVSYNAVDLFLPGSFCDGNTLTTQIVLYESTNYIDILIGNRQPCSDWNDGLDVCGIENASGSTFYCPPGENGTTFSATNLGWRFTPTGPIAPWHYSWTSSAGPIADTTSSITVCPTATTSYAATATSLACPYDVTISAASTVTFTGAGSLITGITTICQGDTSLLANATSGGTWSSGDSAIATVTDSGVVTGIAGGTDTIYYQVPGNTCVSKILMTIGAKPAAPAVTFPTYCQGDASTPLYATGIDLLWYGPGVTTGTPVAPTPGTLIPGTTVYYVTQTSAAGCVSDSSIDEVVVGAIAPVTGVTTLCQGFTTTLSDAAAGGTWTSTAPGVASVDASTGVVTAVSGGTATITYTAPSGCTAYVIFDINPTPPKPVVAPNIYCQGDAPVPVSATGAGLLWYGPGVTTGMIIAPTPGTAVPGTIAYYVTQTSAVGCISDSATDIVTIKPKPAPPVTHDTSFCQYAINVPDLESDVSAMAGATLNWYSVSGTLLGGMPVLYTSAYNYPAGTTWNVSQIVDGCEGNTSPVTVTILPTPKFAVPYNNVICADDSLQLTYSLIPGSELVSPAYKWALPEAAIFINGTSITDSSVYIKFDSSQAVNTFGYLTISNLGMCTTTDTFKIRVVQLPISYAYSNPEVCQYDTTTLALISTTPDASVYNWFIDGTSLPLSGVVSTISADASGGGPYYIRWNDTGAHVISVYSATAEGCRSRPTFDTVQVHALPDATFDIKPLVPGSLCVDDSVQFTAHNVNYGYSYLWQPEHYFYSENAASIWGKVELELGSVSLTVTTPLGCKATSSVPIDPSACCTVVFPDAFSPNGDGHNDFFRPLLAGYHNFHDFRIVNRWGQTVFESTNTLPQWDGTYGGVPQDMGTYFYYIKYDCGGATIEAKGDLTLVR